MLAAEDDSHVYFVETRGRGVLLRATPIDVSALLRELLFDRVRSAVLTSATLAVDGGFEYLQARLGIDAGGRAAAGVALRLTSGRRSSTCRGGCRSRSRRRSSTARRRRSCALLEHQPRARLRAVHLLREHERGGRAHGGRACRTRC